MLYKIKKKIASYQSLIYCLVYLGCFHNITQACDYDYLKGQAINLLGIHNKETIEVTLNLNKNFFQNNCSNFNLSIMDNNFVLEFNVDNVKKSIKGQYYELISIPVINKSIPIGYLINEKDITLLNIAKNNITDNIITNKTSLVNMISKKQISKNSPIFYNDISAPKLIKRNDIVTVIYDANNLTLEIKAIALDNGAKNEKIKFRNLVSKKELFATVISNNKAIIN